MTVKKTKAREITFQCRFCGEQHPLTEMVLLNRYYPPVYACVQCENHFQAMKQKECPVPTTEQLPENVVNQVSL